MARKRKRNLWPLFIFGGLIVAILVYTLTKGKKEKRTEVSVEAVQKKNIIETVYASGNIYPVVEVEITSNVSGTIVELLVEEGQQVKEGQLLARIDPEALSSVVERAEAAASSAAAQLESIKAQKEQLEAQFRNTKIAYERNKKLYEEGVISKAEYDASLASYETIIANIAAAEENIHAAEFTVKSSQATVKEQKKNLSQTRIFAPMSGTISVLYKKKGEQVVGTVQMAGTPILKIANLNSVEAQVKVNERDILKVEIGDTADIELDAYPNRLFKGIVTQISNSANNISALALSSDQVIDFKVHILMMPDSYKDLPSVEGKPPFRAGLSASAEIYTQRLLDVWAVPLASVTTRSDEDSLKVKKTEEMEEQKEYVFLLRGDSVVLQQVHTGIQDDEYIQLLDGVKAQDTVVVAPYEAVSRKLKEGSKIKVVAEEDLYKKTAAEKAAEED